MYIEPINRCSQEPRRWWGLSVEDVDKGNTGIADSVWIILHSPSLDRQTKEVLFYTQRDVSKFNWPIYLLRMIWALESSWLAEMLRTPWAIQWRFCGICMKPDLLQAEKTSLNLLWLQELVRNFANDWYFTAYHFVGRLSWPSDPMATPHPQKHQDHLAASESLYSFDLDYTIIAIRLDQRTARCIDLYLLQAEQTGTRSSAIWQYYYTASV